MKKQSMHYVSYRTVTLSIAIVMMLLYGCTKKERDVVYADTSPSVSLDIPIDSTPADNITASTLNLPKTLKQHILGDYLFELQPVVLIAKGGKHGTDVTKAQIERHMQGWEMPSINPMLLQMGITLHAPNIKFYYVKISDNFAKDNFLTNDLRCTENRTTLFHVTDATGKILPTKHTQKDSTIALHCQGYRILFAKDVSDVPNPGGIACCTSKGGYFGNGKNVKYQYNTGRSIIINEGTNGVILAHEIGHTLGLLHTDKRSDACGYDKSTDYLMRSVASGKGGVLLKDCENKIATARDPTYENAGIKGFYVYEAQVYAAQNAPPALVRRKIGSKGAPSVEEVTEAWKYITEDAERQKYISSQVSFSDGTVSALTISDQTIICNHR